MPLGSDDIYVQTDLHNYVNNSIAPRKTVSNERYPTPRDRTGFHAHPTRQPSPPPAERTGAPAQPGERGASKEALPGTGRSLPGKETDPRQRRVLKNNRKRSPPGVPHSR